MGNKSTKEEGEGAGGEDGKPTRNHPRGNQASNDDDDDIFVSTAEGSDEDVEDEDEVKEGGKMSYWQMAKVGYQQLVNAIIRPPRCEYSVQHLGPTRFTMSGKIFERRDFTLENPRGQVLLCSMWEPLESQRVNPILPCVIYMHGNSSARVEAIPQLSTILSIGATVVSLDFAGSGRSGGDYVSLGEFEKDDLAAVIQYLRDEGKTSTIALWGRSMGAATALMHGERDPSIAGMVLDSAFADLTMLAEEMVDKGRKNGLIVPGFVVYIAIRWIRSSVMKTAGFDIRNLSPIKNADKCFIPALFVAGEGDQFVAPHHSQKIYEKYAGDKNIIVVPGDHNSPRPKFLYDSVAIFLIAVLQIPDHWLLTRSQNVPGIPPWIQGSIAGYSNAPASSGATLTGEDLDEDGDLGLTPEEVEMLSLGDKGVGMTQERQDDIQRALRTMAGQQKQASSSSTGRPSSSSPSSSIPSSSSSSATEQRGSVPVSAQSAAKKPSTVTTPAGSAGSSSPPKPSNDWRCSRCTLINQKISVTCAACDNRFNPLVDEVHKA